MVGEQQVEENGAFGRKSSAYLGVWVCKVALDHADSWSDVEADVARVDFVVGCVGTLHCIGLHYAQVAVALSDMVVGKDPLSVVVNG
jgi:hypothetical protein